MLTPEPSDDQVLAATVRWLERAVIGLNLCPFAKGPHVKGLIHCALSPARETADLHQDLETQLLQLHSMPATERETTLLIIPHVLQDFFEFNLELQQAQRTRVQVGKSHTALVVFSFDEDDAGGAGAAFDQRFVECGEFHGLRSSGSM